MPESLLSLASHFHERTKYDPATIAAKSRALDWEQQPFPFKGYPGNSSIDLKPFLPSAENADTRGNLPRLSKVLLASYGITAQVSNGGSDVPLYLRAAPSAGGLYPAELYVISRGAERLPAGVYNYASRSHALVQVRQGEVWESLRHACFNHPSLAGAIYALVVSAVFYRSVWRYEDRAYRRIFLDSGHLLGNISLTASLNRYRAYSIGGFQDQSVNGLLGVEMEIESAIAVVGLVDQLTQPNQINPYPALPSILHDTFSEVPDGELLPYFHRSTCIEHPVEQVEARPLEALDDKYNWPFCSKVPMAVAPLNWGPQCKELHSTLWQRRSTRRYSGQAIKLQELQKLLSFAYQPQDYVAQSLEPNPDYFALGLLETFLAVSNVEGLDAGCYYYAPHSQELRQIRFKNFRQELHYLCLGQALGRDAAVVVCQTANLKAGVKYFGDRVYRYLHLDAGQWGQRLNLAAARLNLGASGIGGYFDEQVNEILGIPDEQAVVYLTTIGCPA
ncbi:MAG: SagB/ThcOx family dehydrogenase [Cyanobacteria bacterium P01_H01_bin.15]